jgi:hypothetical protein
MQGVVFWEFPIPKALPSPSGIFLPENVSFAFAGKAVHFCFLNSF